MLSQTENTTVPVCSILSWTQPVHADGQLCHGIKRSLGKQQQQAVQRGVLHSMSAAGLLWERTSSLSVPWANLRTHPHCGLLWWVGHTSPSTGPQTHLGYCPGGPRLALTVSALAELIMLFVMRLQKRVKIPCAEVFVTLLRAAPVSDGLPETSLISRCLSLTCSWASASCELQNILEKRQLHLLLSKFRRSICEQHVLMWQFRLSSVLVSSNGHDISCSLWQVLCQAALAAAARKAGQQQCCMCLVCGEMLSASRLKSFLFCENCWCKCCGMCQEMMVQSEWWFFWSLCCGVTAKLNGCLNTFESISSVLGCVVLCYFLFARKVCLVQSMSICYCFWSWHTPCSLPSTCSTLLVLKIPALLA